MQTNTIAITPKRLSLHTLSELWLVQKRLEDEARAMRLDLEAQIVELMPGPEEGTTRTDDDDLKIIVTRKYTYSVDEDAYDEALYELPSGATDPVRWVPKLDLKAYRLIEKTNPDIFRICQKFVSVKPAKPSVQIEEAAE